jgi:hypothetical protein
MPGPYHDQYDILFRHGTMTVGLYAPAVSTTRLRIPGTRLYVVMAGRAGS